MGIQRAVIDSRPLPILPNILGTVHHPPVVRIALQNSLWAISGSSHKSAMTYLRSVAEMGFEKTPTFPPECTEWVNSCATTNHGGNTCISKI